MKPLPYSFKFRQTLDTMTAVNSSVLTQSSRTTSCVTTAASTESTRTRSDRRNTPGQNDRCDVVVIGAGIVGLSFAWQAAMTGRSVTVIDRDDRAMGASTRNFGMIWPIGQPLGPRRERAERSRDLWLDLARVSGFAIDRCGSMHVACSAEEADVLTEFSEKAELMGRPVALVDGGTVRTRFPYLRSNVRLAMMSSAELVVDPREVPAKITAFLQSTYDVDFRFGSSVIAVDNGVVRMANGESIRGALVIVCPGDDMRTLFPDALSSRSLMRCKLQMQRTAPQPRAWRLGPHLAGGLTLLHYEAFQTCSSLKRLAERLDHDYPEYRKWGIHVMVSQNASGECVIGDSHEYGQDISQFESTHIDDLILEYLRSFVRIPDQRIHTRWSGFYAKDPAGPHTVIGVDDRTVIVTGLGGAGMTLGPAIAEELWPQFVERDFAGPGVTGLGIVGSIHV